MKKYTSLAVQVSMCHFPGYLRRWGKREDQNHIHPVGDAKCNEYAQVSPLLARVNAQRREVLGTTLVWAVATVVARVWVHEIASANARHKRRRKLAACLARRGAEVRGFVARALDRLVSQRRSEDAADPVRAWIKIVCLRQPSQYSGSQWTIWSGGLTQYLKKGFNCS